MKSESELRVRALCRQFENGELKIHKFTDALEAEGVPADVVFILHDLQRKVAFLTNIGKLSAEDQVTAYRWEREREERGKLINKIDSVSKANDPEAWQALMDALRATDARYCEHDRSIMSNCYSCEKIEKTLYPGLIEGEDEDED